MDIQRRIELFNQGYWEVPDNLDTTQFDFNWRPDPYDRPYIHQFGTQHQKTGGPRFVIPENEGIKYQNSQHANRLRDESSRAWRNLKPNVSFDYSWHPDDTDPPYIYVFGNQWYDCITMPTVQYRVKGATEKKYVTTIRATLGPNMDNWEIPDDIEDFDYSWIPHPDEPPFIWQFGTQWQKNGGPRFIADSATVVKHTDILRATKKQNKEKRNWRPMKANIEFDYSWHPDEDEPPFVYVFGNQWYGPEIMPTILYRVKGATEKKFVHDVKALLPKNTELYESLTDHPIDFDYSWVPNPNDPSYLYVFGNQYYNAIELPTLMYKTPGATDPKYVEDIKATIVPDMSKWTVPDDIEDGFDYSWIPDPKEPPLIWQFGTQWQKTGGPSYCVPGATEVKYVDTIKAVRKSNKRNWRIIENIDDSTFDFSWHPDSTEQPFTHVFGNDCFDPVQMPTVTYSMKGATVQKPSTDIVPVLSNFDTVYYEDSIFDAVKENVFNNKYIHFAPKNCDKILDHNTFLKTTKGEFYIHLLNGTEALVHRESRAYMYDKITDYPKIQYHTEGTDPKLLDIIFVSNGESCAEDNYNHLISLNLANRVIRVTNVNGRVNSQYAAANASETPWYFLVNAKLKIDKDFDFSWQPNVMQTRKHYIFRALNPINKLEYGHMAMVANNKKLTLATKGSGLDFTMESPHEVVNILSGEAVFTNAWDTWRTSFRECIKLRHAKDKESLKRLSVWTTTATGEFGEYSIKGAKDAIEFYNEVDGDFEQIKQSYDWDWLSKRFAK